MIDVRSAEPNMIQKKDLSSGFLQKTFLLAKHIRRSWLRAMAGSRN
jgi:hypothetical protein